MMDAIVNKLSQVKEDITTAAVWEQWASMA
jgi:hypothetical protein